MRTALFGILAATCLAATPLTSQPANALTLPSVAGMITAADEVSIAPQTVYYGYGYGYYRPWRPAYYGGYYRPWRPYYRPVYYGLPAVAAVLPAGLLRLLPAVLSARVLRLPAVAAVLSPGVLRRLQAVLRRLARRLVVSALTMA